MEKQDIYTDIATRTGGDIFIGVMGPVRTGKSTFITKFMENLVLPNISDGLAKKIATDEMPQSADGKTVMTTQPSFIPAEAVKVKFANKSFANIRLIDCVGFTVEGAVGLSDNDKPRMVKTPWNKDEIPFETAAEIGTLKVISEYSTIGIMVTTDGSFTDINRENYVFAEEKTVESLKKSGKPFVILLNCKNPNSKESVELKNSLEKKYGVTVIAVNALELNGDQINEIMEKVLMEFSINGINVEIPKWMEALSLDNELIQSLIEKIKHSSLSMRKMKDFSCIDDEFAESEEFFAPELNEIDLATGYSNYTINAKDGLFYKVLSNECGEEIDNDYKLMSYIKTFSDEKSKYAKIKDALYSAEQDGYGIVVPSISDMNLDEPELTKQGGKYGIKLKASASTLHIMKVDVKTEVSPMVGTEKQGQDFVDYVISTYKDNPSSIWNTNLFGKSLQELVGDGMSAKINSMPKDVQTKMRKTVSRIVNENKGGVICILL